MIITVHFAIDRRLLLAVVGPNYNWWAVQYGRFLSRDAMLSAVYAVVMCLSVCMHSVCVCVSVTVWYCIKTAKRRITQIMPHDRVRCFVVAGFLLTSASRCPSAIAEPLVLCD